MTALQTFVLRAGSRRRRQRGALLIWWVATLAVCALTLFVVHNTGVLASQKQRVTNAADAAAFSGALVQARALNFIAYSNRSVIAHEAFIVQLVSVDSWLHFLDKAIDNADQITKIVPYIGQIVAVAKQVMKIVMNVADIAIEVSLVAANLAIVAGRAAAQAAYAGAPLAAEQAARAALAASHAPPAPAPTIYPGSETATFALNTKQWLSFTQVYGGKDRGRTAQVVLDSRDQFSTHRPGSWILNFGSNNPTWFAGLRKTSGHTRLVDFDRWEAQDTEDLWWNFFATKKKFWQRISWGRATVARQQQSGDNWCEVDVGVACRNSFHKAHEVTHTHGGWSGIPAVRDVADLGRDRAPDLQVDFKLIAQTNAAAMPTTERLGIAARPVSTAVGSTDLRDRLHGDGMAALGKASVFFARPADTRDRTGVGLVRADGIREYASLFNPYWQARLAAPSTAERIEMYAIIGAPMANALEL